MNAFTGEVSFTSAITLPAHIGRVKATSAPWPSNSITSVAIAAFRRAATRGIRSLPIAVDAMPTYSALREVASSAIAGA